MNFTLAVLETIEMHIDDRSPASCLAFGLECRTCVERSAATVAAICAGMTANHVRSIFIQMYPSQACAQMSATFESAYLNSAAPRKPIVRAIAAA